MGQQLLVRKQVSLCAVLEPLARTEREVEQAEPAAGDAAETAPAMNLLPAPALLRTTSMLLALKQAHYGHKDRSCDYL